MKALAKIIFNQKNQILENFDSAISHHSLSEKKVSYFKDQVTEIEHFIVVAAHDSKFTNHNDFGDNQDLVIEFITKISKRLSLMGTLITQFLKMIKSYNLALQKTINNHALPNERDTMLSFTSNFFDKLDITILNWWEENICTIFHEEKRLTEVEFLTNELKFQTLIESLPQKIFIKDTNSTYISCNSSFARDINIDPNKIYGKTDFDFYSAEKAKEHIAIDNKVIETDQTIELEENFEPNGETVWAHTVKTPIKDDQGVTVGVLGIYWDITDQVKKAQEITKLNTELAQTVEQRTAELEEAQKERNQFFEISLDMLAIAGFDGYFKQLNPSWTHILGWTEEELMSKPYLDFVHPDDRENTINSAASLERGKHVIRFTNRYKCKSGAYKWIQWNSVPMENIGLVYAAAHDITETKEALDALKASEEKYRNLFETMTQGVVYQNAEGHITSANPAAEKILGLNLDQLMGLTSVDPRWRCIHEDGTDFPGETHPAMEALATGNKVNDVTMGVFNTRFDEYRWLNVSATPQFEPGNKKPIQVYATLEDITFQKRYENVLKSLLSLFQMIQNSTIDEIIQHGIDECEKITDSKIAFFHFVNPDQETIKLQTWSSSTLEICNVGEKANHYPIKSAGIWVECFHQKKPVIHNNYKTAKSKKGLPDGHVELIRDLSVPVIENGQVKAILGVGNKEAEYNQTDVELLTLFATNVLSAITRKEAEQKLQKYAETQTVLLREVNHRVKNNLAALVSILHLEQDRAIQLDKQVYLPFIKGIITKIEGLSRVHSMLSSNEWEPINLSLLTEEIVKGSLQNAPPQKKINYKINETNFLVNPNHAHNLTLVINELVINTIKHALKEKDSAKITIHFEMSDESIIITYQDDGPGFPQKIIDGDFSVASIGLDLITGIPINLGGSVDFYNDKGAVVKITLEKEMFNN